MTQWFDHHGIGLHCREDGNPIGPPILFLNSLGTDLRLWDGVLEDFAGHRLIRIDTRGHGLSDAPMADYTLAELTEDVTALVRHLDLRELSVIGVSLGGMMAQSLAVTEHERIDRLVLSNTGLRMGDPEMWRRRMDAVRTGGVDAISDAILDRWFAPPFRHRPEIALWRNVLSRTPAAGYAGCCAALAGADLSATTPSIRCPTLVLAGSEDAASPPDLVREVAEAIPNAQYEEIEGVGHLPMVEAPARFAALCTAFLKASVEPTSAQATDHHPDLESSR